MRKSLLISAAVAGLMAAAFAPAALAASNNAPQLPSAAQMQAMQERQSVLLEAHLAGMKTGLKLTDEQAKAWPAFETAIRNAAKSRADRWLQARERMDRSDRPSAIERMTIMAEHLEKSAADLRAVVEASKPLYDSLNETQKRDFGPLMREFKQHRPR